MLTRLALFSCVEMYGTTMMLYPWRPDHSNKAGVNVAMIQMGGCGNWTGRGSSLTGPKVWNRPDQLASWLCHNHLTAPTPSSNRHRLSSNGIWKTSNSSGRKPGENPASRRPCDRL